ncbi:DUF1934 family protein [Desulfotomaculum defluvii]
MGTNVQVTVKNTQIGLDNKPEVIEVEYSGTLYRKNNNYYIIYQETQGTGMGKTTTTLKVEHNTITLIRNGTVNMRQVFEKDQIHCSTYQTPQGSMEMTVKTLNKEVILTDLGGSIKLEYELKLDHSLLGKNYLEIEVSLVVSH